MFNYSNKQKISFVVILIALIILVVIVIQKNYSRARDLQIISQAQQLANGLEKYYTWHNAYPIIDLSSVENISYLSNQGLNLSGDRYYFVRNFDWSKEATVISNDQAYEIKFDLDNSWQIFNITKWSGGNCHIVNGVILECINKN